MSEDDATEAVAAPYVSNAYVRLGTYYRQGIPNSKVKPDFSRARQAYTYAASFFGNADAQFNLARMYYTGEGGDRDLVQAAKWANLSADKGNGGPGALGHLLFEGTTASTASRCSALMYLTIASERARPGDRWSFDCRNRRCRSHRKRTPHRHGTADDWLASGRQQQSGRSGACSDH